MSKWEMVRLGDVCEILSGFAFDSSNFNENNEGKPLIRIRDIIRGFTNTYYSGFYDDKYIIKNGDLLIGMDGEFNIASWKSKDALLNQRVCKIIPNSQRLYHRYILYFLPKALKSIESKTSYVTVKHLSTKTINQIQIPLPPLDVQKKIAQTLDGASELITLRKKQLAELDQLIKATFYDMFGDPIRNDRSWDIDVLGNVADSRLGKMRDEKSISGNYLKYYLGNSNVRWFSFDLSKLLQMDFNDQEQQKYSLLNGDLLICEGGDIGRCAIWKNQINDCYFQKALHRVRVNNRLLLPEYLQYVMLFFSENNGFKDFSSQSTIAHLTGEKLRKLRIPLPPMKIQTHFAEIVTKIEEQKALVQQAIDESQYLFDSLMSEYFD